MKQTDFLRLGFLVFSFVQGVPVLYRAGTYLGAGISPFHPPRTGGFFRIRTDLGCYDGPELIFQQVNTEAQNRIGFVFDAPDDSFQVRSQWQYDSASGIVSRADSLHNTGRKKLAIRRFFSKFSLQSDDYEIYSQQSRWGLENQGEWCRLNNGALELNSRRGRWTEGGTPFAAIRSGDASNALAFHLIPNGDWAMRFSAPVFSTFKPFLVCEAGLDDDRLEYELAPGEGFSSATILIQELPGRDVHTGSAMLHRYAYSHLIPKAKPLPVLYNTWLDKMDELDVPRLRRQLIAAQKAGCEVFVIDAGWYLKKGDWREKTESAFHGGMAEFASEVHAAGLQFGIWLEPEFFAKDAPVCQAHPEWFEPAEQADEFCRMNFAAAGTREYYYEMFAGLIRKYNLDYIKIDMNASPGRDLSGKSLAMYERAIHEVMLRIKKDFPNAILENCSSGAMRTTLAELPYFDQHFISDNANVLDVLHITQGMLLRFPPGRILRWFVVASSGTFRPWEYSSEEFILQPQGATWKHFEQTDLECGLLASMVGCFGFSGDLAGLRDDTLEHIRRFTSYYVRNRESFQRAEGALLTPPDSIDKRRGVIAFQLTDPELDRHFVLVFYRNCDGLAGQVFRMRGLVPECRYKVAPVFGALQDAASNEVFGTELISNGLEVKFQIEQHGDFKGALWTVSRCS